MQAQVFTALDIALLCESPFEILERLIEGGVRVTTNVDAVCPGRRWRHPIHRVGDERTARLLVSAGADVTAVDVGGTSAISQQVSSGSKASLFGVLLELSGGRADLEEIDGVLRHYESGGCDRRGQRALFDSYRRWVRRRDLVRVGLRAGDVVKRVAVRAGKKWSL